MQNEHIELSKLGWNSWFEQRAECPPLDSIARVAAVDRSQLLLLDQSGPFPAKLAGSYLHRHQASHELPCVGDWVCAAKQPGGGHAQVHARLERKTILRRKAAGDAVDYQVIAANVDCVFIVQSCHFDFNLKRLERYLVMVREGGADACILLTKTDLVDPTILDEHLSNIRAAGISAPVITLSNVTGSGIDRLGEFLLPGMTYCFVGSSGVGKSTLINHLLGRDLLETSTVSGTGEGRHTTVRRELILLQGGALVIDTPGMREFGILGADEGMRGAFADIAALASRCRFRDCTHSSEPRCAVLAAIESGEINREHYENYLKLTKESAFHDMSYAEKRKKDRSLGRYYNSVMKTLDKGK